RAPGRCCSPGRAEGRSTRPVVRRFPRVTLLDVDQFPARMRQLLWLHGTNECPEEKEVTCAPLQPLHRPLRSLNGLRRGLIRPITTGCIHTATSRKPAHLSTG